MPTRVKELSTSLDFAVYYVFLKDIISELDGEELDMYFKDDLSPILFHKENLIYKEPKSKNISIKKSEEKPVKKEAVKETFKTDLDNEIESEEPIETDSKSNIKDVFDASLLPLEGSIGSKVYEVGVKTQIENILKNDYSPKFDFENDGINWTYKSTMYKVKKADLLEELEALLILINRSKHDKLKIDLELPKMLLKYPDINFAKKTSQEAKDFFQYKLRNEKADKGNEIFLDYLIQNLKIDELSDSNSETDSQDDIKELIETLSMLPETDDLRELIETLKLLI